MNDPFDTVFAKETECNRYVFGKFSQGFVDKMLKEYGELCTDSPKLTDFFKQGEWTVIPCPAETMSRGAFFDLTNWLNQNGEKAFGVAAHQTKSYFVVPDTANPFGDTVLLVNEKAVFRWELPMGLTAANAFEPAPEAECLAHSTTDFLQKIGAEELRAFLGL